jgi:hypothetical protein
MQEEIHIMKSVSLILFCLVAATALPARADEINGALEQQSVQEGRRFDKLAVANSAPAAVLAQASAGTAAAAKLSAPSTDNTPASAAKEIPLPAARRAAGLYGMPDLAYNQGPAQSWPAAIGRSLISPLVGLYTGVASGLSGGVAKPFWGIGFVIGAALGVVMGAVVGVVGLCTGGVPRDLADFEHWD